MLWKGFNQKTMQDNKKDAFVPEHDKAGKTDDETTEYTRIETPLTPPKNANVSLEKIGDKSVRVNLLSNPAYNNSQPWKEVLEKYPDGEIKFVVEPREAK